MEKLWLWGGLQPEAKWNGQGWFDAHDFVARSEAKFDASIAADIRTLAGIGNGELDESARTWREPYRRRAGP